MKKIVVIGIFVAGLLTACFSPWQGDEAVMTVNFGGGNGRSSIGWPPYYSDGGDFFRYGLKFTFVLAGPNGTKTESFYFKENDDSATGAKFTFTVAPGTYKIESNIYIQESFLYAQGSTVAEAKAGQSNSVTLQLSKKYFDIGDSGPAGGIIFYVDFGGFTMTDNGQICHYLEAAPVDAPESPNITWGPSGLSVSTEEWIGTGKQNTINIITELNSLGDTTSTYAARICDDFVHGGHSDWFLPSYDELVLMYDNLHSEGLGGFTSAYYWSSSMNDSSSIKSHSFNSNTVYQDWLTNQSRVRPIRAF